MPYGATKDARLKRDSETEIDLRELGSLKPAPRVPRIAPQPRHHRLSNGITVILTPNPGADIVAARLFVPAGSAWEAPAERGLAHLMTATLTKGTAQRSALALAQAVEGLGVGFGVDVTHDYWVMSLKAVGEDFPAVLALAAEVLRSPTFPAAELELEQRMALHILQNQREQVFALALEALNTALYGDHAYGHSSVGTLASVPLLDRSQIQAFYDRQIRPDRLIVSLAGNFGLDQGLAWVEASLGDWRSEAMGSAPPHPNAPVRAQTGALPPPLPPAPPARCLTRICPSQQVMLMLGYRVPGVTDPAYVALKLLCAYLGNGMSSRLFVQLRERQGLAYDVSAFYPTRALGSALVAYGGTAPEKAEVALQSLRRELAALAQEPLAAEVVANLQRKVLGQYLLGQQTNEQLAHLLGWYEVLGLGLGFDRDFQERVMAQTAADLWAVAQTYLQTPMVSAVGPEAAIAGLGSGGLDA